MPGNRHRTTLDPISSRPKLRLLRHLSVHEGPFTGRELARAVGLDQKSAATALQQLVHLGWVNRRRAGNAYHYFLNRDDYLVSECLRPAFLREQGWLGALGAEVLAAAGPGARSVVLYGSWASGEATPRSDIDLLVLVRHAGGVTRADRALTAERTRLSDRFGHPVSFLTLTTTEFRKRLRRGDSLVLGIAERGRILAGQSLVDIVTRG